MRAIARFVACSLVTFAAVAGEPPFPNELLYPNVIPPVAQFGTYGTEAGQFADPNAIAVTPGREIVVADASNGRIQVVTAKGETVRSWGRRGRAPGEFIDPQGVATDGTLVAVADTGNHRLQLFTLNGELLRVIGSYGHSAGHLVHPVGVEIANSRIYVADSSDRIHVVSFTGEFLLSFGRSGEGPGEFNTPRDVSSDAEGNIYVADARNNRIQKFGPDGAFVAAWGGWGSHQGLFATPMSVELAGTHLYVCDLTNHRIQVLTTDGAFVYQWARHPIDGHEGRGRVHYPMSIAVTADEELAVVAEPIENRIQVFARAQLGKVRNVNDSAWWDKATRFHYGSRVATDQVLMAISEPDTHSVLVFDISGETPRYLAKLGGQGRALGQLIEPSGMAIDASSRTVTISDSGNLRLQQLRLYPAADDKTVLEDLAVAVQARRLPLTGVLAPLAGQPKAPIERSAGDVIRPGVVIRDGENNLFVYDQVYSRIVKLSPEGKVLAVFGSHGSGDGQFNAVLNMALSRDEKTLFVVDSYNFRIQALDPSSGKFLYAFGRPGSGSGEFLHPFGIAAGVDGNIYVTDVGKHTVQKFTEDGRFVLEWGEWGLGPGQFYKPKGISQDARGRLFVANFGAHRGDIFDSEGKYVSSFGLKEGALDQSNVSILGGKVAPIVAVGPSVRTVKLLPDAGRLRVTGASGARGRQAGRDLEVTGASNASTYDLRLKSDAAPRVGRDSVWTVEVRRSGGDAPADVEGVAVSALMPAHGHGLAQEPVVRKVSAGTYEIRGLRFHMPGQWQTYVDITDGDVTERAQMNVTVP